MTVPVSRDGYRRIETWARAFGPVRAFGIEGTGSYGAGLPAPCGKRVHRVLEVNRPDRSARRRNGKDDTLDAEAAARAVLGGQATAEPKSGTSSVEMIRHLKVARDAAVKAKTQAMLTLKAIIVSAPAELREQLEGIRGKLALVRHLAALRPGPIVHGRLGQGGAQAIARRWLVLREEIQEHDRELDTLVSTTAPDLIGGPRHCHRNSRRDAAAGRRQPRARPVGGGTRQTVRRLSYPGVQRPNQPAQAQPRRKQAGQRRPPPHRRHTHAPAPAHHRLRRAPHQGGENEGGDHALSQALFRTRDLRPSPQTNQAAPKAS